MLNRISYAFENVLFSFTAQTKQLITETPPIQRLCGLLPWAFLFFCFFMKLMQLVSYDVFNVN